MYYMLFSFCTSTGRNGQEGAETRNPAEQSIRAEKVQSKSRDPCKITGKKENYNLVCFVFINGYTVFIQYILY